MGSPRKVEKTKGRKLNGRKISRPKFPKVKRPKIKWLKIERPKMKFLKIRRPTIERRKNKTARVRVCLVVLRWQRTWCSQSTRVNVVPRVCLLRPITSQPRHHSDYKPLLSSSPCRNTGSPEQKSNPVPFLIYIPQRFMRYRVLILCLLMMLPLVANKVQYIYI